MQSKFNETTTLMDQTTPNSVGNSHEKLPMILFCGKHRVNFAMFEPVYQRLRERSDIEVRVSSGRYRRRWLLGWRAPRNPELQNERLFGEFDIDAAHLYRTGGADRHPHAVYVSSNVDEKLIPRNCRVKVQIFQGVSFRNYAVNPKYLRFDKLFFIGRYHLEQYLERGLLEEDDPRIELIGMPKLDRLVNGALDRETVLRELNLDASRPTVLWCPTGARHNGFEKLGAAGMRALEATGCNVILKLHDHPHLPRGMSHEGYIQAARQSLGPNSRLATRSDVAPYLAAADALITDASSVAFEYCVLDRPIVFIDVPELLQARAGMEDSAMDLETHGRKVGRIVDSAESLGEAVKVELANPQALSRERCAAATHLFHDPGRATQRSVERLVALAKAQT